MGKAWRWFLLITLVGALAGLASQSVKAETRQRPARQGTGLVMVGPTDCPATGCAPGQRMNLRFDFSLSSYSPGVSPNVKVCFYAPTSWGVVADPTPTVKGDLTGIDYTGVSNCAEDGGQPTNYILITAREASIDQSAFSDSIPIALRLATTASGKGQIVARLFEKGEATPFTRTQQSVTAIFTPAALATTIYVANDATACASSIPCFINSADDLANGLGTGLRDAVEASAAGSTLYIIGTYTVKSNMVVIDKQLVVSGLNDSTITVSPSSVCTQPVISLRENITLRNININDGSCASPGRSLVEINSSKVVYVLYNDLVNGDNAIYIKDNAAPVVVRFNRITGNTGYALYEEGNASGSGLEVTANKTKGNRADGPIDCSATANQVIANRLANHNYWGTTAPASDISHCALAAGKRLGAAILPRTNAPGVDGQLVNVISDKTYAFNSQMAYRRNGGTDFGLVVLNHGYISDGAAPFASLTGGEYPSPCGNYWDVFLPEGTTPSGTLELSFKYNKTPACIAAINTSRYCDQTATVANYPLYWFDPATNATKGWDTTGQRPENLSSGDGQVTSCNMTATEIQVALDTSGRPNLNDLSYTPFMVAVPVLRSFLPLASNQNINVTWTTNNEPDISGFYVLRSLDGTNYTPITDLIPRRGSALVGVTLPGYSFLDTNRVNGVTYHYKLQIVRTDGYSIYSVDYPLSANVATITPTRTIGPTFTRTLPRPTNTLQATRIPTNRPTPIPTKTFTPRPVATTITPFVLNSSTPFGMATSTFDPLATLDETQSVLATLGTPPYPLSGSETPANELTETAISAATQIAQVVTTTPRPTPSETIFPASAEGETNNTAPWLSLLLGLMASLAVIGSVGGWWYYRTKS
jgi:hypothetical protein